MTTLEWIQSIIGMACWPIIAIFDWSMLELLLLLPRSDICFIDNLFSAEKEFSSPVYL